MKFRAKSLVRAFGSATTVVSKPTKVYTHISAPLTSLSKNTSLMGRVFSGIGTEFSKMWQSLSMSSTVAQRTVTLTRRTLGNQQTLPLTSQGQLLLHKFDSVFSGGRLENGESEAAMLSSLSTTSSSVNQRVSPVVVDVPVVLTTTTTTNNNDDASVDLKQQENVIPAPRRSSTKKKNVAVDDKVVVMEKMAPRPPMPMPFSANDLQGIRLKKSNTSSSKRKSGVVEESQPPSQPLTSSTSSSSSVTSRPQDTNTATMNDASRVGPFTTLPRPFSMLDIQKGQKGLRKQQTTCSTNSTAGTATMVSSASATTTSATTKAPIAPIAPISIHDLTSIKNKLRSTSTMPPPRRSSNTNKSNSHEVVSKKREISQMQNLHEVMKEALSKKFAKTRASLGSDSPGKWQ